MDKVEISVSFRNMLAAEAYTLSMGFVEKEFNSICEEIYDDIRRAVAYGHFEVDLVVECRALYKLISEEFGEKGYRVWSKDFAGGNTAVFISWENSGPSTLK